MKKILTVILLFFAATTNAQFESSDVGGRPSALNGAFTSIADNSLAIFYNPAGLGQMTFREISFQYNPAPFGLSELSSASVTYAEPTKIGTFGAGIKTYGFELYRETNFLISYGNNYRNRIFYGINLNLYYLKIERYNSAASVGVDVGAMAYLTKFLKWGFFGKNISGSKIGQSKEPLAQVYRTGFTLQPRNDLSFILEAEKDIKYPFSVRGGMEYSITNNFDIRAGVGSEPTTFSGGIGIFYNIFQMDYSFTHHQDLGFIHQGTLTINWGGIEGKNKSRDKLRNSF